VGIQIISRFLHSYIPSHVVDCDHHHEDPAQEHDHEHNRSHSHSSHGRNRRHSHHAAPRVSLGKASESTPLLPSENAKSGKKRGKSPHFIQGPFGHDGAGHSRSSRTEVADRRPSMVQVQKRVMSFVKDTKGNCDSQGPCFGYSDPCGQECFKHLATKTPNSSRSATIVRSNTGTIYPHNHSHGEESSHRPNGLPRIPSITRVTTAHSHNSDEACESDEEGLEAQHHHHVPENAFMSIGLQTSIAIALHKLPEGFITYATNHANPNLGFSVFMALFIHNITEGFAMALPLYLALQSRFRAMFWASLLGGVSQPLGAGIAAAWFKIAGREGHKPGTAVYGCMFAVTAGIMVSVALQLFVESLSLNHNRNLCIAFAFIGMAIMGVSNALTSY